MILLNKNTHDTSRRLQQDGGTSLVTRNKVADRVLDSGRESSGLGIWFWVKINSIGSRILSIITAYRPHKPAGFESVGSNYQQYFKQIRSYTT